MLLRLFMELDRRALKGVLQVLDQCISITDCHKILLEIFTCSGMDRCWLPNSITTSPIEVLKL